MAKTPIELIAQKEFESFKAKYLDNDNLTKESLEKIRLLFGMDTQMPRIYTVSCDESHSHEYKCLTFYNYSSAIVERLVDELEKYTAAFSKIEKIVQRR